MQKNKLFTERVYEFTAKIPKGSVATYKQLAALSGNSRAFRAVGMCMKKNPKAPAVPCHRVVASDGSLCGYSMGGVEVKRQMLLLEGVYFKNGKVDLARSQWKEQP